MAAWREIRTAADADQFHDEVVELVESFYHDRPLDLDDLIRRLEREGPDGVTPDFGTTMMSPAIQRVGKIAREAKRAMQ